MFGAVIGDIIGSRFEVNNYRAKDFKLFTKDNSITDDSVMTFAVSQAMIETANKHKQNESFIRVDDKFLFDLRLSAISSMKDLGRKYPSIPYGGRFKRWLLSDTTESTNSFGNGAAMRISPVGHIAQTENELKQMSAVITGTTHSHPQGIKGAEAAALSVFLARNGKTKEEIKTRIERDYYALNFTIDEIRPTFKFDLAVQNTVPQAIQAFLESADFEDAIRIAVSLGGDSDTIAAITGAIAEGFYGIPVELELEAKAYLDEDLTTIYNAWQCLVN